ncbi:MAG: hypothetical protein EHM39_13630 [Chloroflexi bacterium]|nr:MAG: hypothetical protein EHM39_13630 [Chloroflexota bacterium]
MNGFSLARVWAVLTNPAYAGAYAYGRLTQRAVAKPLEQMHRQKVRLPPEHWLADIWQAFPGYITQAEFEAHQAQLASHHKQLQQRGRRQDGMALLSGILMCGRCGHRMTVVYSGKDHQHISYVCNHQQRRYGEPTCQSVPGREVDQAMAAAVLAALTPAQVELSLAVLEELERQQALLHQQWTLRLEAAGYAVRLAQRRYEQVDPDNRLVARTLEHDWEARLQEQQQLIGEYEHFQRQAPLRLDETQRQQLRSLAEDLPQIWQAATTTWAERKELLRLLVADVTLTRLDRSVQVQLRWHTNQLETFSVALPLRGAVPIPEPVIERVRALSPTHSDQQVAEILNQEGVSTAQAKPFTAARVLGVRRRSGIRRPSSHDKNNMCL